MGAITPARAIRYWPPVAMVAMLLLGWAVGTASTPVDDWFLRDNVRIYDYRLVGLFFTDWRLVIGGWLVAVARVRSGNGAGGWQPW